MSGIGHLVSSGPLLLAVPVAAAAGAVTFLSPCVLPLVPGYLSYVTGMSGIDAEDAGRGRGGKKAARPGPGGAGTAGGPGGADTPGGVRGARASAVTSAVTGAGTGTVATSTAVGPGLASADRPSRSPEVRGEAATAAAVTTASAVTTAVAGPPAPVVPGRRVRRRAVLGTALFVLGFSAVYASEGVAFGGLGTLLQQHSVGLTQVFGAVTIVLGLLFAGVLNRLPAAGRILRPSFSPRAGLAGAPMLGMLFGLSWTPCVGPTLTVVLTMSMTSGTAVRGAILTFAYGLGLGLPFLIVALGFERGVTAFRFARRHARAFSLAGGVMLVAVGILEVTGAWSSALVWLQTHWITNYRSPI